jgi:aspartyl-tRNA(Asn)/glutamyl-tRNA(Gln) amidotransferase subunit C
MAKVSLSSDKIDHVAHLARIKLTSQEKEDFSRQISDVLSYMDRLQKVDTKNIPPTFQITLDPLAPVDLRQDQPQKSQPADLALSTASRTQKDYLVVPATIHK